MYIKRRPKNIKENNMNSNTIGENSAFETTCIMVYSTLHRTVRSQSLRDQDLTEHLQIYSLYFSTN